MIKKSARNLSLLMVLVILLSGCGSFKESNYDDTQNNLIENNKEVDNEQQSAERANAGNAEDDENSLYSCDNDQVYKRGRMSIRVPGCKRKVQEMKRE